MTARQQVGTAVAPIPADAAEARRVRLAPLHRRLLWASVGLVAAAAVLSIVVRAASGRAPSDPAALDGEPAVWLATALATVATLVLVAIEARRRWLGDFGRSRRAFVLGALSAAPILAGVLLAASGVVTPHAALDLGYLVAAPCFTVAVFLLPTPPTTDRWERTLDVLDGIAAGLGTVVVTLWLLPDDVSHGLNAEEVTHIVAVTSTVAVLVYTVARQRRSGGVPVAQLELLFVGGLLVTAGYIHTYRASVGVAAFGYPVSALAMVAGCLVASQSVGGVRAPAEGPQQLRRREWWATYVPVIPVGAGLLGVAWYATQPIPLPYVVGTPMVLLVYVLVALFVVARVLLEQQARRLREDASRADLDAVLEDRWFRSLVGETADLVVVLDPDATVRYASPAVERALGLASESLRGRSFMMFLDDAPHALRDVLAAVAKDPRVAYPVTLTLVPREGRRAQVEGVVSALGGEEGAHGYVLTLQDVTDLRVLSQRLESESRTDTLTGLPNRGGFLADCEALALDTREPAGAVMVALDLNRFGLVNDARGHEVGDELLQAVAGSVRSVAPPGSPVGRVGGDEFAVLLRGVGRAGVGPDDRVRAFVRRLVPALDDLSRLRGDGLPMACHVGYAVSSGEPAGTLLRHAQVAQGVARTGTVHDPVRYDAVSHAEALAAASLEAELARAVELGQLEVAYQPLVRLSDTRPVGAEALLRWQHPVHGLLPPDRFIPLAEASGLIAPIGQWVLEQACHDFTALADVRPAGFRIGVNVSPVQITSTLADEVVATITAAGVPTAAVVVEVTESAVFQRLSVATDAITRLRAAGVAVALDDFGTGYSSLSLVTDLPIDVLKIDRSFVHDMATSGHALALIRSVLQLAESLRLSTTAEGVETDAEARLLQAMGCEQAQGFRYARPLPLDGLRDWLATHSPSVV